MRGRATIAGHPIHQILIPIPLGLLVVAVLFDLIVLLGGSLDLSIAAFWMIVAGVISGVVTAVFGVIDWTAIPRDTRASRIGIAHGFANLGLLVAFGVVAFLRMDNVWYLVTPAIFWLEVTGFVLGSVGGYLGGELVVRHAVGVHEDARPDAPPWRRVKAGERPGERPVIGPQAQPTT